MHEIVIRPVLGFNLAFGLDWQPLISGKACKAARRVARQRKASHIVLDGESPASFGYGLLRTPGNLRRSVLHSAAQNMARLYPTGSVACILPLGADDYWLVAVHEGAVMGRTDVVCRSIEQARQALEALQRSHPRLVVLSAEPDMPSLKSVAMASDSGTLLRDTGRRYRQWMLWLCLFILTGAASVALLQAGLPHAAQVEQPVIEAAEIESRWNEAVQAAERRITLHGVAATHSVLRRIYDMPARLAGWVLTRAACQAEGPLWRCVADFDRRHPYANNEGLLEKAPPEWRLSFPSIERASAAWEFRTFAQTAGPQRLDTSAHNRRHLQSAWQNIRPAFSRIDLGASRPVELQPPLDDEGHALPRPAGIPQYFRSSVQFEGPLRSVSLLLPHTRAIGWRSFSLAMGTPTSPTLVSSRLRATLHGDLYELLEADKP